MQVDEKRIAQVYLRNSKFMIKLLMLDFDGVIVDSAEVKTEAFKELFSDFGEELEEIINYHLNNNALSRFIKFKHIYENILNREYDSVVERDLGRRFSEIVFKKVVDCPYIPGAIEFLDSLYGQYPMYLISATPHEELMRIVEERNLLGYFKGIFGVPPGSKHEHMLNVLDIEGVKPSEAIYIGDMMEDYRIAQSVGVKFVGKKGMEDFGTDGVISFDRISEIKNFILH